MGKWRENTHIKNNLIAALLDPKVKVGVVRFSLILIPHQTSSLEKLPPAPVMLPNHVSTGCSFWEVCYRSNTRLTMGTSGQLIGYYPVKWVLCEMQHLSKRGHLLMGLSNWSTV